MQPASYFPGCFASSMPSSSSSKTSTEFGGNLGGYPLAAFPHLHPDLSGFGYLKANVRAFNAAAAATPHLLLTDLVMPKVSGRELAACLKEQKNHVKVLFMSGYSDDIVLQHRLTERNVLLLQKPFTSEALLDKVREALSAEPVGGS